MTPTALEAATTRFWLAYLGVGFFFAVWLAFAAYRKRDVMFESHMDLWALCAMLLFMPLMWPAVAVQMFDGSNRWKR